MLLCDIEKLPCFRNFCSALLRIVFCNPSSGWTAATVLWSSFRPSTESSLDSIIVFFQIIYMTQTSVHLLCIKKWINQREAKGEITKRRERKAFLWIGSWRQYICSRQVVTGMTVVVGGGHSDLSSWLWRFNVLFLWYCHQ